VVSGAGGHTGSLDEHPDVFRGFLVKADRLLHKEGQTPGERGALTRTVRERRHADIGGVRVREIQCCIGVREGPSVQFTGQSFRGLRMGIGDTGDQDAEVSQGACMALSYGTGSDESYFDGHGAS
jgi:hypothetical protein